MPELLMSVFCPRAANRANFTGVRSLFYQAQGAAYVADGTIE